jgi:hypothetical protein
LVPAQWKRQRRNYVYGSYFGMMLHVIKTLATQLRIECAKAKVEIYIGSGDRPDLFVNDVMKQ